MKTEEQIRARITDIFETIKELHGELETDNATSKIDDIKKDLKELNDRARLLGWVLKT